MTANESAKRAQQEGQPAPDGAEASGSHDPTPSGAVAERTQAAPTDAPSEPAGMTDMSAIDYPLWCETYQERRAYAEGILFGRRLPPARDEALRALVELMAVEYEPNAQPFEEYKARLSRAWEQARAVVAARSAPGEKS